MYLLDIRYDNAALNVQGRFSASGSHDELRKWTVIASKDAQRELELLRLLALGSSGCTDFLDRLSFDLKSLAGTGKNKLHLEILWKEHIPQNRTVFANPPVRSALEITDTGRAKRLFKGQCTHLPAKHPYTRLSKWSHPARHPVFAYGSKLNPLHGDDDFDFGDAFYQLKRIHSLFDNHACLTHAPAFLNNLHYRAVRCRRYMPAQILKDLQRLFSAFFGLQTSNWLHKDTDFSTQWEKIPHHLKLPLLPVIDAARHLHDALPSQPNPLHFPGVMILDRPERYCPQDFFPHWIELLEHAFPAMQFITALSPETIKEFSWHFPTDSLPEYNNYRTHYPSKQPQSGPSSPLPPGTVLLVDMDNRLPNLALMKLSRHYKKKGYRVELARKKALVSGAETVFASCVFDLHASRKHRQEMQAYYGANFHCGGSGVDVHQRLPEEIEDEEPDFGLYPELEDRALGFLTRGCPFKCSFCIVPIKEGKPRQVSNVDSLVQGRKKLILLDDNILAHPDCEKLLEEMALKQIAVNFNQTLDLSLMDESKARLLRKLRVCNSNFTRNVYHFSLNDNYHLESLRKKYELLNFNCKDNVEFICMYGYNTTLAQDLERFRFLRSLPGAYVFAQKYQPFQQGPQPRLEGFFDEHADEYIDELIQICYPQCMKSMEKYYRWLSRMYVECFGKLHMGLVDTIFRYNRRFNRGKYIASLAGTRKII